jgi:hypothetical protein
MMCSDLVVFFIYLTNNWTTYDDVFIWIILVICCHLGLSQKNFVVEEGSVMGGNHTNLSRGDHTTLQCSQPNKHFLHQNLSRTHINSETATNQPYLRGLIHGWVQPGSPLHPGSVGPGEPITSYMHVLECGIIM